MRGRRRQKRRRRQNTANHSASGFRPYGGVPGGCGRGRSGADRHGRAEFEGG